MTKKLKIILLIFAVCLIGAGVFYFSDTWKRDETLKKDGTQTVQNLKLLTSHSSPEVGEEWVVSFETRGTADLTITPNDQQSIDDLDFISLTCDGKEKKEEGPLQVLEGDVIFYSDWQCAGKGEIIHLVNVARKHTLKFQFSNKMAFAYNNPDSVTDTFDDESKIASKENITVSGGQVKLSTLKSNGETCSSGSECESTFCVDGYCCNSACTGSTCQICDTYSSGGAGTCGYVNDSGQDPDDECDQGSTASDGCRSNNCSGSDYTCGAQSSGDGGCPVCGKCTDSDIACETYSVHDYDSTSPGTCSQCQGCSSIGNCGNDQSTNWGAGTHGCGDDDKRCYGGDCFDCSDTGGVFYGDGCSGCSGISNGSPDYQVCFRHAASGDSCIDLCAGDPYYYPCLTTQWDPGGGIFAAFGVSCDTIAESTGEAESSYSPYWKTDPKLGIICVVRHNDYDQACPSFVTGGRRMCVCQL